MIWFHGEMLVSWEEIGIGRVLQFRYSEPDGTTVEECIQRMQTRYMASTQFKVLWIEEGFTPRDTSRWDGWVLFEPDSFNDLTVTRFPC